jgi:hypothetical protein
MLLEVLFVVTLATSPFAGCETGMIAFFIFTSNWLIIIGGFNPNIKMLNKSINYLDARSIITIFSLYAIPLTSNIEPNFSNNKVQNGSEISRSSEARVFAVVFFLH